VHVTSQVFTLIFWQIGVALLVPCVLILDDTTPRLWADEVDCKDALTLNEMKRFSEALYQKGVLYPRSEIVSFQVSTKLLELPEIITG
jgi:hypothetical protein